MIPKIIHYCWFGGNPLPDSAKYYISTWKKYCPDYEYKEWNEDNFDVSQNAYCKEAYETKKWAFVTDYVRLKVLADYGGIYMDTDVEVVRPLDDFLSYDAFSGYESNNYITTGTLGACQQCSWVKHLLKDYDNRHFIMPDGNLNLTTNVEVITKMTKELYGLELDGNFKLFGGNCALFPFDYFCAKDFVDGRIKSTSNTYTIHHFSGSWLSPRARIKHQIKILLVRTFGKEFVEKLKNGM